MTICCLQETYLSDKNKQLLRIKEYKNLFCANGSQKQKEVAILKTDKVEFKKQLVRKDKGHFMLIKGTTRAGGVAQVVKRLTIVRT
jgi:hypothetical protein